MDDPLHIKKFNHDISRELQVDVARSNHMRTQDFDYFLVLDLEGKVEIIEFPVILVNAKTMGVTGFFHRFYMLLYNVLIFAIGYASISFFTWQIVYFMHFYISPLPVFLLNRQYNLKENIEGITWVSALIY